MFYTSNFSTCIRNRAKCESLDSKNFVLLTLKVILDCASKTVFFSAWLYVSNGGKFSSWRTTIAFYLTFLILFVFNTICNKTRDYSTPKIWIGKEKGH